MEQLKLYSKDESQTYELPKAELTIGGDAVGTEIQMAAGNLVRYIQGYRKVIRATWDYFPADLLAQVTGVIRSGGWYRLDYPDIDGTDKSGYFKIEPTEMGVFTYLDGAPVWHSLTLAFTARDVEV